MLPIAGCSFGISGNNLEKNGLINLENIRIAPPFSPTFIMPNQKHMTPVNPNDISNAVLEESVMALMVVDITVVSPRTISLNRTIIKDIMKNKIQI